MMKISNLKFPTIYHSPSGGLVNHIEFYLRQIVDNHCQDIPDIQRKVSFWFRHAPGLVGARIAFEFILRGPEIKTIKQSDEYFMDEQKYHYSQTAIDAVREFLERWK